jgi:hypothetical protein
MSLISKSLFAFIFLFCSFQVAGQDLKHPVKFEKSIQKISATEYQMILTGTIDKGWKLYVEPASNDGPIPFNTWTDVNKNLTVVQPFKGTTKAITAFDPVFKVDVNYYKNSVVFVQTVKLEDPKQDGLMDIGFEYMVCDDEKCLAPTIIEYSFLIENSSKSSKTESVKNDLLDTEF